MNTYRNVRQILILDQDPVTEQILGVSLRQAGFQVLAASMVEDALDVAANGYPDLILVDVCPTDVRMMRFGEQLRQADSTKNIPVLLLVDKVDEERVNSVLGGSFDYIVKPLDTGKVLTCVKSYLPDLPHEMDVNPFTDLPGLRWIEHELLDRMVQGKPFALVNVGINSLRPFRNVYGSTKADHAIRLLARIIREAVRLFGNDDDLVGHVGEDDFYIISSPDRARALAQRITSKFDDRIKDLYRQEDVVRGYLEGEYPAGRVEQHSIMTLSIGVTTSENCGVTDPLAARRIAGELRERARAEQGSAFRFDQRRDAVTLEGALGRIGRRGTISLSDRTSKRGRREQEDFVRFATSQLRVPVTIVQSALDYMIQTGHMNLAVEQKQYLEILQKHIRHLSDIVTQLATLHKFYEGDSQTRLEVVDLARVLEQVAELVRDVAVGRNVHVEIHGAENIGPVIIDEQKLCQVILYTLYSTIEYSRQGSTIRIDVGETETRVRLSVVVDDLSLGREDLARVFRSFYQPQKLAVPNQGSLGLGFHLAKQLLSSIGGTITVRRRDYVCINLDFPKVWQSVEESAKAIQREIAAARALARIEMGRVEALLPNREAMLDDLYAITRSVHSSVEQIALEANRAVALVDEVLGRLSRERERAATLDAALLSFLEAMVDLIEKRDRYFAGHSRRVASDAFSLGRELRLSEDECLTLYYAGLLHDLGMVAVSDRIVTKVGELSEDEVSILRKHSVIGARFVGPVKALGSLVQPILHHHEKYDGTGYPSGLKGERIPFAARILAVLDAFDAMVSGRPYKPPVSIGVAMETIVKGTGAQFDPRIVEAFCRHVAVGALGKT